MKSHLVILVFFFCSVTIYGQSITSSKTNDDNYILVYVDLKKKILLNGQKSNLKKLEKYLQTTNRTQAKIGTIKPTPLDVFAKFEKVVQLMKNYCIESKWYSDNEFTVPFFKEVKQK